MFQISVREVNGISILDCSGKLTMGSPALRFHEVVHHLSFDSGDRVLVSLSELKYADSSGVGEIVSAWHHFKKQGGTLALFGANSRMLDFFQLTQLVREITFFLDEASAIKGSPSMVFPCLTFSQ